MKNLLMIAAGLMITVGVAALAGNNITDSSSCSQTKCESTATCSPEDCMTECCIPGCCDPAK